MQINNLRNLVAFLVIFFFANTFAFAAESPEKIAMKKIMAKQKATGGDKGPIGALVKENKLTRCARSKEFAFYLEFSKAGVITSPYGTFYMYKNVFTRWLEKFPSIDYPRYDPPSAKPQHSQVKQLIDPDVAARHDIMMCYRRDEQKTGEPDDGIIHKITGKKTGYYVRFWNGVVVTSHYGTEFIGEKSQFKIWKTKILLGKKLKKTVLAENQ